MNFERATVATTPNDHVDRVFGGPDLTVRRVDWSIGPAARHLALDPFVLVSNAA